MSGKGSEGLGKRGRSHRVRNASRLRPFAVILLLASLRAAEEVHLLSYTLCQSPVMRVRATRDQFRAIRPPPPSRVTRGAPHRVRCRAAALPLARTARRCFITLECRARPPLFTCRPRPFSPLLSPSRIRSRNSFSVAARSASLINRRLNIRR